MAGIEMHACELAYAMAYAKVDKIIGWGKAPFEPPDAYADDPAGWYAEGERRLRAAGRLTGTPEAGLDFTLEVTADILTLVDPNVVLMAERKDGAGVRKLTVHATGARFVGLIRGADGLFVLTRYADLTAAAGACAGFLGASFARLQIEARVDTTHKVLETLFNAAEARPDDVVVALTKLGLEDGAAQSAMQALSAPAKSGVLSVFYCAMNAVQDVEPISVMTNEADETWLLFPPASLEGPMVLERSSVAALTARVSVGITARMTTPD